MANERIVYLAMGYQEWSALRLGDSPFIPASGVDTGSIGFMEVFDDPETARAVYPGMEILKIAAMQEDTDGIHTPLPECPECRGIGEIWSNEINEYGEPVVCRKRCEACNGSGCEGDE